MTSPTRAPGPRGHFLLGSLREFNRDILGLFDRIQKEYGDIVRLRLAHTVAHVVCHPTLAEQALITDAQNIVKYGEVKPQRGLALVIGDGLILSYGELWRRQRDLMTPMFRPRALEDLSTTMLACGAQMLTRLKAHAENRTPADIWHEARRTSFQVVMATLFGAPETEDFAEMERVWTVILRHCFESERNPLMPPPSWPTPRNRRFRAALKIIDDYVNSVIRQRLRARIGKADLLGLLLDASHSDADQPVPKQVRDEMVTMLGAGHETTASALTWALVQIAQRPDIAEKIRAELTATVGNGELNFSHLRHLRYLPAVVQETLRLYSPAPAIRRAARRDTVLGGYHIPAGSMLFISVYNIHRHPEFWPNPHEFNPDRFLEPGVQRVRCAYLPFGAGERFCIGSNFATIELSILLAQIVGAFDLQLVENRTVAAEVAVTLRPTQPVYMQVQKRRSKMPVPAAAYH